MAEQANEKPIESGPVAGPPTVVSGPGFAATAAVNAALSVLHALDSVPPTNNEIAEITKVLGTPPPGFGNPLLSARPGMVGNFRIAFTGSAVLRFSGTAAETALKATWGDKSVSDSGFIAGSKFPEFVNPVPQQDRGNVGFAVTIAAFLPKYPAQYSDWTAPTAGVWLDTLAHELCLHAEPDCDDVLRYRDGATWPLELQVTQHWLFLFRGVHRYLLWLRRLIENKNPGVPDLLKSLKSWAAEQPSAPPASVAGVLSGHPNISHLRELTAAFHLPPPAEDGPVTVPPALHDLLATIVGRSPLWWLPG